MDTKNIAKKNITKPMWHPAVDENINAASDVSKYFGNPWLSASEAWPVILGEPALFVLQLNIKTLPTPIAQILGNSGLLQFFFQTNTGVDLELLSDLAMVRIVDNTLPGQVLAQPDIEDYEVPQEKIISGWIEKTDFPHMEDCPEYNYEDDEQICAYQGDKLGGWPFWTQGNETPQDSQGEDMIYVYQLDAGCFFDGLHVPAFAPDLFAGDGTGHIFVSRTNPKELTFMWACG